MNRNKIKDKERDSIDFGKSRIEPLFQRIFFPTLLSMVFASLFTVADGIFVGQGVGSNALAAINIVAPLFLITTGIALMFGSGMSIVASIHLAQNNNKAANIIITQAFHVATLLMVIVAIAVYSFRIPFLRLLGCSDALLPLCQNYLLPILPGCIFIVIQMIGTFAIRLDGSPKFAASLEIFPGLLNIFLDWLFVFPMQMGIAGSAIASSISCAVAAGMVVWYMFFRARTIKLCRLKLSLTSLYLTTRNVGYMARSGFSSMLGELAMSMVLLTGNYVFIRELGEDGVAAFSVACYLYPIVFMINNAVAQSAQPIISFNYGAGNRYRVQRAFRVSLSTAIICGVLVTVFLTLCSKPLVNLFLQTDTKAYEIAIGGLPLFAYSAIFFAMNVAIIGYYQATEQNTRATLCMLFRGLIFLVPAFILMPMFIFPQGMWLAVPVTECTTLGVLLLTKKESKAWLRPGYRRRR
ncbi:MAG: MATE family efflux transporter [Bacteroidaceae bacterium]|nr:MATE family efflux transporter [Bacteroidaceae bacterium]